MNREQLKQLENIFSATADNLRANTRLRYSEFWIPVLGLIFFSSSKHLFAKYSSLFNPGSEQKGDEGDDLQGESERFNAHWGWFATIHHLSETSILKITGDTAVTDLNFIFVLNYLISLIF